MKKRLIIILLAFNFSACNILDQESEIDVAEDNVFTSEAGANAALLGLYSTLQARDYYGGYYYMMADLHSDVSAGGGFDNVSLDELNDLAVTPSNIFIEQTWIALYNTINTANAIINNVDAIVSSDFTQEERNHIKGQALAIRALAHFDVLRMFGEHWNTNSIYGIPLVTTKQNANDVVERSTVSDTYQSILTDLATAYTAIISDNREQIFVNPIAVKAIEARVRLYQGDNAGAVAAADVVINDGNFSLLNEDTFLETYTAFPSSESIFELTFDVQNRSAYNSLTYSRTDALRTEVLWLADEALDAFFQNRPDDARAQLVNFSSSNDNSILPDGRSEKFRGEELRNNPALLIRMAEVYLIRAEAKGRITGLQDLNELRTNRGMAPLVSGDVSTDALYDAALLDERKAELNFEGHRLFDLARTQQVTAILGIDAYRGIFPIPFREITATKNRLIQNPGYQE